MSDLAALYRRAFALIVSEPTPAACRSWLAEEARAETQTGPLIAEVIRAEAERWAEETGLCPFCSGPADHEASW
jgi:hypothetical protein